MRYNILILVEVMMYFKRKAYDKLLEWKKLYSEKYAVLLEGARRVGKSTIAKNEYRSYIMIDFSKTTSNILECFDDIGNLNIFFLRLQAETGITLYEHESLIIFDEVQLFPKARQAIKHLVHDGRYSYLETGSLISIKKNVKDILIPSEEMKQEVYPIVNVILYVYQGIRMWSRIVKMSPVVFDLITNYIRKQLVKE